MTADRSLYQFQLNTLLGTFLLAIYLSLKSKKKNKIILIYVFVPKIFFIGKVIERK